MREVRFQLKGWAAVPVIVVVIAFLGYRLVSIKSTLASEAAEKLKVQLRGEYAARLLDGIQVRALGRHGVDPRVQEILDASKIEFPSISSRGTDPVYVKVEIRVDGREPPDGKSTRYYEMRHSGITGWSVVREMSALRYYLKLF